MQNVILEPKYPLLEDKPYELKAELVKLNSELNVQFKFVLNKSTHVLVIVKQDWNHEELYFSVKQLVALSKKLVSKYLPKGVKVHVHPTIYKNGVNSN